MKFGYYGTRFFSSFIFWNLSVFLTKHMIVRDPSGKCLPSSVGCLPSTRMVVFSWNIDGLRLAT